MTIAKYLLSNFPKALRKVKVFMGYYLLYIGCNGKKNPETSKYFAIFYYLCGRKVRNEAVT